MSRASLKREDFEAFRRRRALALKGTHDPAYVPPLRAVPREVVVGIKQRDWQRPLVKYFRDGGKRADVVAHRRAGKDRVALFIELEQMLASPCEAWHALPSYKQARKVVWDALTKEGERVIDVAFPPAICRKRHEDEMKIELVNGALWRLVGADNFDSLVGANPRHVTFSEYALTSPLANDFVRPILAENGGTALYIYTPRGYNHAHAQHQMAVRNPRWYAALHPVSETGLIDADTLAEERRNMPDELYRQEYECDFSAANVGSILGRYIEQAEKDNRITLGVRYDPTLPLHLVSDIGFRDAAAWWWVQPMRGGFKAIDYDEATGLDAEQWIERIRAKPWKDIECIHLPHDARAKTFRSRHTVVDVFLNSKLAKNYRVVPQTKIADRINAARIFARRCEWSAAGCALGLMRLRDWKFKYDVEKKTYSTEPDHDDASHGGDAFSYVAVALGEHVPKTEQPAQPVAGSATYAFDLNKLFDDRETGRI